MTDSIINPTSLRERANALFENPDATSNQLYGAADLIDTLKARVKELETVSTSPPVEYHRERILELGRSREFALSFEDSYHRDGLRVASEDGGKIADGLGDAIYWHARIMDRLAESTS